MVTYVCECVLGHQDPGKLVVSCFFVISCSDQLLEMVLREMVSSQQRQANLVFLEGRKTRPEASLWVTLESLPWANMMFPLKSAPSMIFL